MKTFNSFVKEYRAIDEKKNLDKEYEEVFDALLKKYKVKSPADLDDAKKSEFFDEISKYYTKGKGKTKEGEKLTK